MELNWSEQAVHIRTLYASWKPGDGYEESSIAATEDHLGIHVPDPLRGFYRNWGKRKEMTRLNHPMLEPDEWILRPDAFIFCVENQGTSYWAILHDDLKKANPPVVKAWALPDWEVRETASPLIWEPNHAHASDFLDTLTYHHALCGGALHGGWAWIFQRDKTRRMWLEQDWQRKIIAPMVIGLVDDFADDLPFYVRPGQALFYGGSLSAATCSVADLDTLGQIFQITWRHRW